MNVHLPSPRRRWPARLVNLAVVVVVLALAAATFVLSYTGVHVIALQAGVSARFARVYPATFDAVLVIACVAAVTLRDARWWARAYAWFTIILMVGVVGAADAVHAMNVALQHRTMEGVVAATPWVLVLLGFSLMLTMLRHSRAQHATEAPQSRQLSRRAAKRAAEQAAHQTGGTVEQPAQAAAVEEGSAEPPAEQEPQQTPAPEATAEPHATAAPDTTPTLDAAAGPDATAADAAAAEDTTPAPESGASGADRFRYEDVTATAPDQGDEQIEPAVSWHDYWDTEQGRGPGGQAYPATATEADADADAPPFAAAPFATVPRLNRVRSTPTPPEEDEE